MITNVNYFQQQKELVPVLVKIREAARLLSVSRATVHNLIQSGDLIASRLNPSPRMKRRHVRITRASLLRFYLKRFGHPLKRAMENPFEV